MGYYRKEWTEELVEARLREGRGTGTGKDYRPLLEIHDVPSNGLVRRVLGLHTGRDHHLLSNNEFNFFLILDWLPDVIDIQEQFPLDRDLTQEVAIDLGIKHPYYPRTDVPIIMSVDFLVTRLKNGQHVTEAYDVKGSDGVDDSGRTVDKLEIARTAMELVGVPHDLVFNTKLPKAKVENLEWIRGGNLVDGPDENEPYTGFYDEHCALMALDLESQRQDLTLTEYCRRYDARAGVRQGVALAVAKRLMQRRVLIPTLGQGHLADQRLSTFALSAPKGQLRSVGGA